MLREPAAIAHRFVELEAAAVREILFFTEPPYAIDPEQNVQGLRLLERRIEARSVYERSLYDHPPRRSWVSRFARSRRWRAGAPSCPLKLVVIDERVAPVHARGSRSRHERLTIMIGENLAFAWLLRLVFEAMWASGEPFE